VSGERDPIRFAVASNTVLARAVEVLGRFPHEQSWVLIGGVAVFIRLGSITRPTADADTIARSQAELIQQLVDDEITTVISGGDVHVQVGDGNVEIDVMDLADNPLPANGELRAFALARRAALSSAVAEQIIVTDPNHIVIADAIIPVATIATLSALKTVSMVRRPHGKNPAKVGSDIHDLVRLTATGARAIASELVTHDRELAIWIADQVGRAFGPDIRYTLLRLRKNDRSPAAQALTDDEVAATVILADSIREYYT